MLIVVKPAYPTLWRAAFPFFFGHALELCERTREQKGGTGIKKVGKGSKNVGERGTPTVVKFKLQVNGEGGGTKSRVQRGTTVQGRPKITLRCGVAGRG